MLLRNLSRLGIRVYDGDPSYVAVLGIVEGHPRVRFDFSMWYFEAFLGFVEVTGDREDSEFCYILSEKVSKARELGVPVWFMYQKKRKWLILPMKNVVVYGTLVKWLRGERPYYRVHVSKAKEFRAWVNWLRYYVIPALNHGQYREFVKAWVI